MPFYQILGDWDEMGPVGDAEVEGAETGKADQQVGMRYMFIRSPACLAVRALLPHIAQSSRGVCFCFSAHILEAQQ